MQHVSYRVRNVVIDWYANDSILFDPCKEAVAFIVPLVFREKNYNLDRLLEDICNDLTRHGEEVVSVAWDVVVSPHYLKRCWLVRAIRKMFFIKKPRCRAFCILTRFPVLEKTAST